MDSKKLEILMTAVNLGSFSKASEVVGYTQSGLTHLVNSLEREMGLTLIHRNHNGVSLTREGQTLMPAIREFLQANQHLQNQIQTVVSRQAQGIRVAAYSSIAMRWMPEILYRFRRACPEVNVDLRMVDHALEPFELLRDGKTDVIFASRQSFDFCAWSPLYWERMYAILPKDYPLHGRDTLPLSELAHQDFLMPYGRFDIDVHAALQPLGIHLREKPAYVDDETVIRMVGKGLGVSMMTELMIRGRTDDVLCVPVSPTLTRELGMGLRQGRDVTPSIRTLRDCVMDFLGTKAAPSAL